MGRNAGGVIGTLEHAIRIEKKGENFAELNARSVDKDVYVGIKQAKAQFDRAFGKRKVDIVLADIPEPGKHREMGRRSVVMLQKKLFKRDKVYIGVIVKHNYDVGQLTQTNNPFAHTITHELAHNLWNSAKRGRKYKQAGQEIESLYKKFLNDKSKKGYGKYASKNASEFWSEAITKSMYGDKDDYTTEVRRIVKKHKL